MFFLTMKMSGGIRREGGESANLLTGVDLILFLSICSENRCHYTESLGNLKAAWSESDTDKQGGQSNQVKGPTKSSLAFENIVVLHLLHHILLVYGAA